MTGASRRPRTVAVIQARLGSTRLPGKILKPLAGRSVLEHVVERCRAIPSVDAVCCATTTMAEDEAVVREAERIGALVYRGSSEDVLARYAGAARMAEADVVLRVTSDCPLIDPWICERTLRLREAEGVEYCPNNMPRLFPHGLDCEAFTRAVLERAERSATTPYEREHVTPWMRHAPDVTRSSLIGPGWPSVLHRWTLDYPEDYDFFAALFPLLPAGAIPSTESVLSLLAEHPEIAAINRHRRIRPAIEHPEMVPTALLRFEADQRIGLGHAMRSSAFATLLEQAGWRICWAISSATAGFLGDAVPTTGVHLLAGDAPDSEVSAMLAAIGRCDIAVVDLPARPVEFGMGFEALLRKAGVTVVAFDDLAAERTDAAIIVNPAPTARPADYAALVRPDAAILTGPSFAMLRSQFAATRARATARLAEVETPQRVMVAFGGTDPLNGTEAALEALAATDIERVDVMLGAKAPHLEGVRRRVAAFGPRCRLLIDVAEVAEALAACDLVIGAPGGGTWERACLGLPSLLVGIAENQRANAESTAASGASRLCGFLTTDGRGAVIARLRRALGEVRGDPELYRRMHRAAQGLCDGRGPQRLSALVVGALPLSDGAQLSLRLAEADDAEMLYRWQQAPETRRHALNQAPFSHAQHVDWLGRKLGSARDWFLIGEAAGSACGLLRLDWFGEDRGRPQYLISIATAPGQYRRGVGRALLRLARRLVPGGHFYAKVLEANAPSLALFRSCGYQLGADGYFHATESPAAEPPSAMTFANEPGEPAHS